MRDLTGRQALVCGASGGIGRASALALAARGATVAALARNEQKLGALMEELHTSGASGGRMVVADLDDRAELRGVIEAQLAAHGPVHVLVNNTGGPPPGPLLAATEDDFLAALGRHLFAAHLLVRLVLPGMIAAGFGRIVNVVSTSVYEPIPNLGVSNVTRAAVAGWAKTLAGELPPGITINNVLPGFTDTERLVSLGTSIAARRGCTLEDVQAEWAALAPEGRLGRAEELGAVVAFLASTEASFVRGQSIAVDGGRMRSI